MGDASSGGYSFVLCRGEGAHRLIWIVPLALFA